MRTLIGSLALTVLTSSLSAAILQYDGSYIPSPSSDPPFSHAIFADTTMQVSAGALVMTTYPGEGLWYGYHAGVETPSWPIGSSTDGNYVGVRTKLSEGSIEWSIYLYDGQYAAAWYLDHNLFRYLDQTEYVDLPGDLVTDYHNLEFWLQNGQVSYAIDGRLVFSGPAFPAIGGQYLIIGDGSAYGGTGVGSMFVDSSSFYTSLDYADAPVIPASSVPEPSTAVLAAAGLLAAVQLRRRAR